MNDWLRYTRSAAFSESQANSRIGSMAESIDYDLLIDKSAAIYREDGTLLARYFADAIPPEMAAVAYKILSQRSIVGGRNNRGSATGKINGAANVKAVVRGGEVSSQNFHPEPSRSAVIGYFNRESRFPYCRQTAFTSKAAEQWMQLQPFIRQVGGVFREGAPEKYQAQASAAAACSDDFIIAGTPFSTMTVNHEWRTAYHKDAGDCIEGLGVMACFRAGNFRGGHLVLPRYRVAFDLASCSVILFDVHEVHGNTEIIGVPGRFRRVTTVFYLRDKMKHCLSALEEEQFAKNRRIGDSLSGELKGGKPCAE